MRIIIAGSREFKDYEMLRKVTLDILAKLQYTWVVGRKDIEILSGMATGADKLGKKLGDELKIKVVPFPAKWDDLNAQNAFIKYKADNTPYNANAGFARNKQMAEYAAEDTGVLIAFTIDESKGTKDMIKHAKKCNLDIYVVNGYDGKIVKGNI